MSFVKIYRLLNESTGYYYINHTKSKNLQSKYYYHKKNRHLFHDYSRVIIVQMEKIELTEGVTKDDIKQRFYEILEERKNDPKLLNFNYTLKDHDIRQQKNYESDSSICSGGPPVKKTTILRIDKPKKIMPTSLSKKF